MRSCTKQITKILDEAGHKPYVINEQVVNSLEKYTVEIVSIDPDMSRCSGVIIHETEVETHILTAKHCIDTTEEQYVEDLIPSFIITSPRDDLALMIVDGKIKDKQAVTISAEPIKKGDHVNLLGYPYWDKTPYTADGLVIRQSEDWIWALFMSIGGCSGGGVFNDKDELVGILWGGMNSEDISIFESNADVAEFLLKAYERLQ